LGTIAWSAVATFVILQLVRLAVPLRAEARHESVGLDVTQHGEEAYSQGDEAILIVPEGADR
ncbi:MAG TPA: ammonia channel protein, partial [Thermoanaerobaculia bacterium]|nr:ammonia channel protein [Thermoanaerobaculia bacterium]